MAKRFTIGILMDLAKAIGANPNKFMGTKTNITFLGKGPTKNPLFQNRLAGLENASVQNLGKPETLVNAVEDAMSFASAGKLNTIQTEILGHNLLGIKNVIKPPPLPMASVTPIRGLGSLKSDAKFSKFFGYPKHSSGKRMSTRELIKWRETNPTEYDAWRAAMKRRADESANRLIMEGKVPDERGRTWNLKAPGAGDRLYNKLTGLNKPRLVSKLPEPGPGDIEAFNVALNQKTGMSRAIAREILQQDTRLKLPEEVLISLRTGSRGPDPLDLMKKYYGRSMENFDDFLNNFPNIKYPAPKQIAARVLNEVELVPQFAEGGLAGILEV